MAYFGTNITANGFSIDYDNAWNVLFEELIFTFAEATQQFQHSDSSNYDVYEAFLTLPTSLDYTDDEEAEGGAVIQLFHNPITDNFTLIAVTSDATDLIGTLNFDAASNTFSYAAGIVPFAGLSVSSTWSFHGENGIVVNQNTHVAFQEAGSADENNVNNTFGLPAASVALIESRHGSVENFLRLRNQGQI